jgi:HSP20 family protein
LIKKRRLSEIIESSLEKIENEMDKAIEELLEWHPMWDASKGTLEPLSQIVDTGDKIIITMDLPYVNKENIDLKVCDDSLEIDATLQRCIKYEHWVNVPEECEFKSLHKDIRLSEKIIPEETNAKFTNGILTIELVKIKGKRKIKVD